MHRSNCSWGIRLGAYEFIEKPFSTEKILNYIIRALETAI